MRWICLLRIHLIIVSCLNLAIARSAFAEFLFEPFQGNGLPQSSNDETQFWRYRHATKDFVPVSKGQENAEDLYVRYDFGTIDSLVNRWVWVTGQDPRAIAPGSTVQGMRLGIPVVPPVNQGLNWYRLENDSSNWHKVTDRNPRIIYRWTRDGSVQESSVESDNWPSYGGNLDPLPGDKPKCTLTVSSPTVKVSTPFELKLRMTGEITDAVLDDQKIPFYAVGPKGTYEAYEAKSTLSWNIPGFKRSIAIVHDSAGQTGTCDVRYSVLSGR